MKRKKSKIPQEKEVVERRKNSIKKLLKEYSDDKSVLGVILVGSTGKGYNDKQSDLDLEVIVTEDRYTVLEKEGKKFIHTEEYDLIFTTISQLRQVKESEKDIDHWWYQDCPVLLDKTDSLEEILKEITKYDSESRVERLKKYYIGYWQNSVSAIGCISHKNDTSAKIYAALAMRDLIRLLFNLNNRWAPNPQWAFKELPSLERKPPNLESKIENFLERPTREEFAELWEDTARLLRKEKYTWIDRPEQIL